MQQHYHGDAAALATFPDTNAGRALQKSIDKVDFFRFPDSTVMVCMVTLRNGTRSIGVNHGPVKANDFSEEQGRERSLQDAVDKALPFVAFMQRERDLEAKEVAAQLGIPAEAVIAGHNMTPADLEKFKVDWEKLAAGAIGPMELKPLDYAYGFYKGEVVVCVNPEYADYNKTMTVAGFDLQGSVKCTWFPVRFGFYSGAPKTKWFHCTDLEKLEKITAATQSPAAPGASEHYTSPHGFTVSDEPVHRDDSASGCGNCGGCGCAKGGPYAMWVPDVAAAVRGKEADGYTVKESGWVPNIPGARVILEEEWELLVAQHKLDEKRKAQEGAKP